MRISADKRDSGYRVLESWGGIHCGARVLLNGEELKSCVVTADEELGEVLVHVFDKDGRAILDGDEWRSEWRRGKVEIIMPGRDAA